MRAGELDEIGQPRHRAVVIHDLAQHGGGIEAREPGEIAACLGVSGAREHAAGLRDRAGRRGRAGRCRPARAAGAAATRIVCARSAAEMPVVTPLAASIDTVKFVPCTERFVRDHRREVEPLGVPFGDRHADEAAPVLRHEVDLLRRHEVGGENQIALVFAVLVVDEDHHPAGLDLGDDLGDWCDGHGRDSSAGRRRSVIPAEAGSGTALPGPGRSPGRRSYRFVALKSNAYVRSSARGV